MRDEVAADDTRCDVLFFVAGGQTYGADPRDVLRVDRGRPGLHLAKIAATGDRAGSRGLIIGCDGHEVLIPVEAVSGVRSTPRSQLRPVPAYLTAHHPEISRELLGVLLQDAAAPILVLDLKRVSERATPPEARTDTSHGQDHRFG